MDQLNIIIVGAGIAGLTCGISLARYTGVHVTVLERSPVLGYVGNGIQVPCNAGHVLRHLGLLQKLLDKAGGPALGSLSLNYSDGRELLKRDFTRCQELYGAPWILAHRADYMDVLLDEARRLGVDIKLGYEVEYVDFETPWLRLTTGQTHYADVIVGCDGLHSKIRSQLHPSIQPSRSGSFAYRVLFTPTQLSSPSLRHITTSRECRLWLGPGAHAVFYPVCSGTVFNLVVAVADPDLNTRCEGGDALRHVREWMAGWDPTVREILNTATELVRFPLLELPELPSWGRGFATFMGDAAHPTLPYLGQGAAMAVEDAVVLGTLLGLLKQYLSPSPIKQHIPTILQAFASIQRPRTTYIVAKSRQTGSANHLMPGTPEQLARDAAFMSFDMETCVSDSAWTDAHFNRELLGRKAADVAEGVFEQLVKEGAFEGPKL